MKRLIALLAVMALMIAVTAMPAFASHKAQQRGLVNVNIDDITVQLPVGIAANVCDVNAAVLAAAIADTGSAECTAKVDQQL